MKIITGYLYHIKDDFFDKLKNYGLMINHENGHSRPSYLAIKDKDILWFIPLSTKVSKYKPMIENKRKKYGSCKTIMIKRIAGRNQVILIQNAFPTLEKYVKNLHTVEGKPIQIANSIKKEIINNFESTISLKEKGINLFFTDIDKIMDVINNEIKMGV